MVQHRCNMHEVNMKNVGTLAFPTFPVCDASLFRMHPFINVAAGTHVALYFAVTCWACRVAALNKLAAYRSIVSGHCSATFPSDLFYKRFPPRHMPIMRIYHKNVFIIKWTFRSLENKILSYYDFMAEWCQSLTPHGAEMLGCFI